MNHLEEEVLHPSDDHLDTEASGTPCAPTCSRTSSSVVSTRWGRRCRRSPRSLEVIGIAGPGDTLIQVVARDADDLYRVAGRILAIRGVKRTRTLISMRTMVPYRLTPLLTRLRDGRRLEASPEVD